MTKGKLKDGYRKIMSKVKNLWNSLWQALFIYGKNETDLLYKGAL